MLLFMAIVMSFKLFTIITKRFIQDAADSSFQLCFADTFECKSFIRFL